jgi:hypothetical protein
MYKLAKFNLMGNVAARMLPNDPSEVIDIAQNLGKVKNKVAPTQAASTFLGGVDNLTGDIGAGIGVMTAAGGAGVNKMLGANTNLGNKLKQMGVNTVLDGDKSKLLGRGLLGTGAAAAIGGTGLGVKGYLDKNMEQIPEELMGETDAETAQNWLAYKNANGGFSHKQYVTFSSN